MVIFAPEYKCHCPEPIVVAASKIDLGHLAEVGKSHTVVAFARVVVAANYVGGNPSRVDLDGFGRIGDRTSKVTFASAGEGAVALCPDVSRVDRDRPARLCDSLIVIARVHEESSTCHVSVGKIRIDLDCLAFVGEGLVVVALSPICSSAMTVSDRAILWAKLVRLNKVRAGGNDRIVGLLRLAKLPVLIDLSQRCIGRRYNDQRDQ
jgi:hypothetical protein